MMKKSLSFSLVLFIIISLFPNTVQASNNRVEYPKAKLRGVTIEDDILEYHTPNWSSPSTYDIFQDSKGNLCIFSATKDGKHTITTFNDKYTVESTLKLKIPKYDYFGTFTRSKDGNYYVVVGYDNSKESPSKVTVEIHKVSSKNGEILKTGKLHGNNKSYLYSIRKPFAAGTVDLVELGDMVYIYMSQLMFVSSDGKNHQSSNLYGFDANTMKLTSMPSGFFTSHSFNQKLIVDGNDLIAVSHGDAHPRAMRLIRMNSNGKVESSDFLKINGEVGDNRTGSTVTGLIASTNSYFAVGTSIPHNNPVNGKGNVNGEWYNGRNAYLSVINKNNLGNTKHIWLTEFDPNNKNIVVSEPKITEISEDKFAIVYGVVIKGDKPSEDEMYTEYKLIDGSGNILESKRFDDKYFKSPIDFLSDDGHLFWLSPHFSKPKFGYSQYSGEFRLKEAFSKDNELFIFELDASNPKAPEYVEGIKPTSILIKEPSVSLSPRESIKPEYTVMPKNTTFNELEIVAQNYGFLDVSEDGWITTLRQLPSNYTTEAYIRSTYEPHIHSTIKINVKGVAPPEKSPAPKAIQTPASERKGFYSKYTYYPFKIGYVNTNIKPAHEKSSKFTYTMESSDESVAVITEEGVKSVGIGKTTITFRTKDNQTASCVVEVFPNINKGLTVTKWPTLEYEANKDGFDPSGFEGYFFNGSTLFKLTDEHVKFELTQLPFTITHPLGKNRTFNNPGTQGVRVVYGSYVEHFNITINDSTESENKPVNPEESDKPDEEKKLEVSEKPSHDMDLTDKVLSDSVLKLSCLGTYLHVNSAGEVELNNSKPIQEFTVTSIEGGYATIQTMDGKYFSPENPSKLGDGNRVIVRDEQYLWNTNFKVTDDGRFIVFAFTTLENGNLILNASGESNKDETPIIVWTSEGTKVPKHAMIIGFQ